ncbi:MAG TPA: hypothetical protein VMP03_01120, partial [Methylomirabilota bacterium]|nr:hypothetical protein [Methylomirabilota bacterium]
PVMGPVDIIGSSGAGALDEDLGAAALRALTLSRADARAHALRYTWARAAGQFLDNVRRANGERLERTAAE